MEPLLASSPDEKAAATTREAIRLFRRYQVEIVEAFNLCPWAQRARSEGAIAERVFLQSTPDLDPILTAVRELSPQSNVELCIFLFPNLAVDKPSFDRFVSQLVREDAEHHGPGRIPFAMAAFHPEASADMTTPDRLIPFLRRTPDPTIQLVRSSVLERVKSGKGDGTRFVDFASLDLADLSALAATKSVRQRIGEANLETVQSSGVERLERITESISRDRAQSYSRIADG